MSLPDPTLLNAVGQAMADAAPDGWKTLTLDVTAAANMTDVGLDVTMPDGTQPDARMRSAEVRTVNDLRKAMYQSDKGTWYNATFTVDDTGKINASFDYDNPPFGGIADDADPECEGDAEPDLLLDDHKMYPRSPDSLPRWHPAHTAT